MYSKSDASRVRDAGPSSAASFGPWPVGVRGLLTALGMLAALALRAADRDLGLGSHAAYKPAPVLVLDPNTAPPAVLGALPHVGPSLVRKLVEQREVRPFSSIEDMRRRVRGLGPATMARLALHLRIAHGRDPIDGPEDPVVVSIRSGSDLTRVSKLTRP